MSTAVTEERVTAGSAIVKPRFWLLTLANVSLTQALTVPAPNKLDDPEVVVTAKRAVVERFNVIVR